MQHVTQVYEPLAEAASAVYFVLQDMQVLQPSIYAEGVLGAPRAAEGEASE